MTADAMTIGTAMLYVPPVAELIALCEAFGRPKDRERARLLRALADA